MPPKSDLSAKYEEERLRSHEQSQIMYLQGQIDELRRLIKDQHSKYQWAMEQSRKTEVLTTQVQSLFQEHAEEVTRMVERTRRDIVELRKEVSTAVIRTEEEVKPIREMQVQIHQLAEARKQDRDFVTPWLSRIEEVEEKLLVAQAQIKEDEERQRQLSMQLDRLREADAISLQEIRRLGEEFQVEKQSTRRQVIEGQQLVSGVHGILDEHASRIARIDDLQERIRLFAESLPEQITEIGKQLPDITTEIKRVERVSTEWFMMNQDRLEDLRQQVNEKTEALQEVDQQHLRQLTAWLERVDSVVRELDHRQGRQFSRLEYTQKSYHSRIGDLLQRELQTITALSNAFREQAEAVKMAQGESREAEEKTKQQLDV
ncbi:MAG: hypothetical protein HC837_19045 [Chloroflexaceae bacterium]|nr:hypothetical protein [Chloroflexaceae bacterium]